MNANDKNENLVEELEDFLDRACMAESEGNRNEAERFFRLALFCEGTSQPCVPNAEQYVSSAGPVYR